MGSTTNGPQAVSLFSNCGAGDVGYRAAGFRFRVMAELDPRRLEVCLLNHPEARGIAGDLRKTRAEVIEAYREACGDDAPALLCACPPCQGLSSARSGRGRHDDVEAGSRDARNLLATVIAEVAAELVPKLIVIENVQAFLTRRVRHPVDGRPISAANYLLHTLHEDYVAFPFVTNLCDYGVPQSRVRTFLTFVHRDVEGLDDLLRLALAPYPRPTTIASENEGGPISMRRALEGFNLPPLDAATPETAKAEGYGGLHCVPVWSERVYEMIAAIPVGTGRSAWQNDRCLKCEVENLDLASVTCGECGALLPRPIVRDPAGGHRLIRGFGTSYRRMFPDRPAATITTASGRVGSDYTIHPTETRLLSAHECALLQTFPSDFVWGDALKKWGPTNVREMVGEAVPPAFTRLHGQVLMGILDEGSAIDSITLGDGRIRDAWDKLRLSAMKDGRPDPQCFEADPTERGVVKSSERTEVALD